MRKSRYMKLFIVIFILLVLPFFGITASAQIQDDYAPILYFEDGETCYPVNVNYFLANVVLSNITIEREIVSYYDASENLLTDYQNKIKSNDPVVAPTVFFNVST